MPSKATKEPRSIEISLCLGLMYISCLFIMNDMRPKFPHYVQELQIAVKLSKRNEVE